MAAAEHNGLVCPRCGQPLHRERRRVVHRVLSIVYPVHRYGCSPDCGWTGIFLAGSRFEARKRHLVRIVIILLLALAGLAAVRHLALNSNQPSSESDE